MISTSISSADEPREGSLATLPCDIDLNNERGVVMVSLSERINNAFDTTDTLEELAEAVSEILREMEEGE